MIFVTVSSGVGFDRLIKAVDDWCEKNTGIEATAQIGNGIYQPTCAQAARQLSHTASERLLDSCTVLITEADCAQVTAGLRSGKSVIVMPRRTLLSEAADDHQVKLAEELSTIDGVYLATDGFELQKTLSGLLSSAPSNIVSKGLGSPVVQAMAQKFLRLRRCQL